MSYNFKLKPFEHQLLTWENTKDKRFWAYLMEMGTGKSKLTIDVASYMYDQGWVDAMIIFGNNGSYLNWYDEHVPEHMPDHMDYEIAYWTSGAKKEEREKMEALFSSDAMAFKIFVMNIEALAYERSFEIAYEFTKSNKTLAVIDESTTIKNHKAKRTKGAWKIASVSAARRILTGSCIENKPTDSWAQFQFLADGALGYSSFYSFRAAYAKLVDMHTGHRSFKKVVGYKNIDKLRSVMSKYATIIKAEECTDLPDKIYETYYVELTKEQIKHYTEMKKQSITVIEETGSFSSAKIALTQIIKLQQILCGHLKLDTGEIIEIPHNRIKALMSLLDETNGKAIIWSNSVPSIREITTALKKEYGEESTLTYYGETGQEERTKAKTAMKAGSGSDIKFLVGNPTVGGYGLNLTGVNTVIYYSNSYDNEVRQQSEKRAHRIGQVNNVTYIDLCVKDSVDMKILDALRSKKSLSDMITVSNWKDYIL